MKFNPTLGLYEPSPAPAFMSIRRRWEQEEQQEALETAANDLLRAVGSVALTDAQRRVLQGVIDELEGML